MTLIVLALYGSAALCIGAFAYLFWGFQGERLYYNMGFICNECRDGKHCNDSKRCDCQHKAPAPQVPTE